MTIFSGKTEGPHDLSCFTFQIHSFIYPFYCWVRVYGELPICQDLWWVGHKHKWNSVPLTKRYSGDWLQSCQRGSVEFPPGPETLSTCRTVLQGGGSLCVLVTTPGRVAAARSSDVHQFSLFLPVIGGTPCIGQRRWLLLQCHPQECKPLNGMLFSVGYYSVLRGDFRITFMEVFKSWLCWRSDNWQCVWFPCHAL